MKARENPFRVDRVLTIRYRPQGWTFPQLMDRLAALKYRAAIVGPEGSGKTTLLEDLAPHLANVGLHAKYLRLDREHPKFHEPTLEAFLTGVTDRDVICLDGCEQLPTRSWPEFLRRSERAGGLIVTTHQPGRLETLITCSTTPALLGSLIDRLIESSHPIDVNALHAKHRGNIREALRELYNLAAN